MQFSTIKLRGTQSTRFLSLLNILVKSAIVGNTVLKEHSSVHSLILLVIVCVPYSKQNLNLIVGLITNNCLKFAKVTLEVILNVLKHSLTIRKLISVIHYPLTINIPLTRRDVKISNKELDKLLFTNIGRSVILVNVSRTIAIHRNLMSFSLLNGYPSSPTILVNYLNLGIIPIIPICLSNKQGNSTYKVERLIVGINILFRVSLNNEVKSYLRYLSVIDFCLTDILRSILQSTIVKLLQLFLEGVYCKNRYTGYTNISLYATTLRTNLSLSKSHC